VVGSELLGAVRHAAAANVEARIAGDGVAEAARQTLDAARAALDGGHSISAIAAAEADGEREARERSGAQLLRTVERSARKLAEATNEHEAAIAIAVRVGLPARDIAARAGVSHGTVAAIARRREQSNEQQRVAAAGAELASGNTA
jgi:DNA-binding NarL/FixJ family response regulator